MANDNEGTRLHPHPNGNEEIDRAVLDALRPVRINRDQDHDKVVFGMILELLEDQSTLGFDEVFDIHEILRPHL